MEISTVFLFHPYFSFFFLLCIFAYFFSSSTKQKYSCKIRTEIFEHLEIASETKPIRKRKKKQKKKNRLKNTPIKCIELKAMLNICNSNWLEPESVQKIKKNTKFLLQSASLIVYEKKSAFKPLTYPDLKIHIKMHNLKNCNHNISYKKKQKL